MDEKEKEECQIIYVGILQQPLDEFLKAAEHAMKQKNLTLNGRKAITLMMKDYYHKLLKALELEET